MRKQESRHLISAVSRKGKFCFVLPIEAALRLLLRTQQQQITCAEDKDLGRYNHHLNQPMRFDQRSTDKSFTGSVLMSTEDSPFQNRMRLYRYTIEPAHSSR